MDVKHHFEVAWNLCLKHIVSLIILTLVVAGVSVISLGILFPVALAGYTHSLLLLIKENREPKVQDVFSKLGLFFPLLGFFIVVFIVCGIGFMLLFIPGLILSFGIAFCALFMLPILVDKEIGAWASFMESIGYIKKLEIADYLITFVIYYILTAVGSSSMIGFIILQPFATLFLLSVYESER
ncbi:MAG: hypothetical protein GY729_09540 [Desulfobacteraceae bacterium]|nr:hypothetical protein [Desulfobacteraceae bacterium]